MVNHKNVPRNFCRYLCHCLTVFYNSFTVTLCRQFAKNCYYRCHYNLNAGPSRGWSRGLATPGPATFGGPAVCQKYKVHQNVPFWKKIQKFSFQRGTIKMFGGPARMFPRAPLWLSTGLLKRVSYYVVKHAEFEPPETLRITGSSCRKEIKLNFIYLKSRIDEYHTGVVQFQCAICHH